MDLSELRTELLARGFSYLSDDRANQLLNWANHELDDFTTWPYREASVTGTSPLTISDLGSIEAVLETTTNTLLYQAEYADLVQAYGDLSVTGFPIAYYLAQPTAGQPEVATYPSGASIGVQYWKVTSDLSEDTDTPLSPDRFHHVIVDLAACRAYLDRDDFSAAQALRAQVDQDLLRMADALEVGPLSQQITGASADW